MGERIRLSGQTHLRHERDGETAHLANHLHVEIGDGRYRIEVDGIPARGLPAVREGDERPAIQLLRWLVLTLERMAARNRPPRPVPKPKKRETAPADPATPVACPACGGEGWFACTLCDGQGWVTWRVAQRWRQDG
jgi:hypothetical protein